MKWNIVRECPIVPSARVSQVCGMFDVSVEEKSRNEIHAELKLDEREWNVGLIVGPSGSGKTTLAKEIFGSAVITDFHWPADHSILDAFPESASIRQVTTCLQSVGFGTVPNWMRPYHVLSNGEQFRALVARGILEKPELLVIDEFTSVVDRQVAKIAAHCVQKTVRKNKQRFVGVSCHYDIIDWLQPDWVYEPHLGAFEWRFLQGRPAINLEIRSVGTSVWPQFSKYHYLSPRLNAVACIGGFIDGQCVAFSSVRRFVHPRISNILQEHRTVVLPDYQGLGLGVVLTDWFGEYLWRHGWRFTSVIAHPALIAARGRSPRWHLKRASGFQGGPGPKHAEMSKHHRRMETRLMAAFEYTPPKGTPAPRRPMPVEQFARSLVCG